MQHPQTPNDNSLAVASLVLGIFSLTGASILAAIPAIIMGAMSLKNPVNKGFGIAGIVMGIVSIVLTLLIVVLFVFVIGVSIMAAPESNSELTPNDSDNAPSVQQRA